MDVILRLENLMKDRGWSVYELARRSGLPQSTLSNLFNRRNQPTILTLEQVCKAMNLSLSQFFATDNAPVEEKLLTDQLLDRWAALSLSQKQALLVFLQSL